MNHSPELQLQPRDALRFLGIIALGLLAAHIAGLVAEYAFGRDWILGISPLFDFDRERNVPTLFSASLFLMAAALGGLVAGSNRAAGRPHRAWFFLAGVACFLAVDEVASIHEMFAAPLRESLGASGFFRHAWVIPYGIVAAGLALAVAPVFLRMRPDSRRRFFLAGGIYVSGAVGLEMVGGKYQEMAGVTRDVPYEVISTVEESMEMAGLMLVVYALLRLLRDELGGVTVTIPARRSDAPGRTSREVPAPLAPEPSGSSSRPAPARPRAREDDPAQNIR